VDRSADSLEAVLDLELPERVPIGTGTAVLVSGACHHPRAAVRRLEIVVDGRRYRPDAWGMPRLDRLTGLHPGLPAAALARARRDPGSPNDPDLRCYRSGFWAIVPVEGRASPGGIEFAVEARLADGSVHRAPLGSVEVVADAASSVARPGLIAVCVATFDPEPDLLRVQVETLRGQTDREWICVVRDDGSRPERYAAIEEVVGDDPRFRIIRGEERLGFYRNFERLLEAVPPEAELVALCDQDDRWYPDKLATLRATLGDAELVCSDTRLVDAGGEVLSETLWSGRTNNVDDIVSLLLVNSVPGAATLFRRRLLDAALPFPSGPGMQFHDHWIATAALATGRIAYVNRPLYDYIQHRRAVQGRVALERGEGPRAPDASRGWGARARRAWTRWRGSYHRAYLPVAVWARVLLVRCGDRLTPRQRRGLRRVLAAEHSPFALAWLAARPLRRLLGRDDTLGMEWVLVRGIAWRWLMAVLARGPERPRRSWRDAGPPPFDPADLGTPRLRRWRAGG
jgi:glycosyltransferase involved in cell wall biosynthesis